MGARIVISLLPALACGLAAALCGVSAALRPAPDDRHDRGLSAVTMVLAALCMVLLFVGLFGFVFWSWALDPPLND